MNGKRAMNSYGLSPDEWETRGEYRWPFIK